MVNDDMRPRRRWRWVLRVMLPVNIVGTLVAYVVMLAEVESVVASGPLLFLAGAVTMFAARAIRYPLGMLVGAAQVGICVLFVSLVNVLGWGPRAAERPFALMGIAYMMGFIPAAVVAMRKVPQVHSFGSCEQCGYLLFGLTTPRCPECGREFDPALLPALSQTPGEMTAPADA